MKRFIEELKNIIVNTHNGYEYPEIKINYYSYIKYPLNKSNIH